MQGSERVDQDVPKAMELFRRASEHGHVSANGQYGFMLIMEAYRTIHYDHGRMHVLDWLKKTGFSSYSSFLHDKQKRIADDVNSVVNLTNTYKQALKVARYAHNRGDSTGTFVLGFSQLLGLGVDIHTASAIDLLQSAASRNNADANYMMAEFLTGMRSRNHFRSRHFIDELNHLPEYVYQTKYEDSNEYLSQQEHLVTESEKLEHRIASDKNNFMDFATASQLYAGDVHFLEAIVLYVGYILRCSYIYLPFLFLR